MHLHARTHAHAHTHTHTHMHAQPHTHALMYQFLCTFAQGNSRDHDVSGRQDGISRCLHLHSQVSPVGKTHRWSPL